MYVSTYIQHRARTARAAAPTHLARNAQRVARATGPRTMQTSGRPRTSRKAQGATHARSEPAAWSSVPLRCRAKAQGTHTGSGHEEYLPVNGNVDTALCLANEMESEQRAARTASSGTGSRDAEGAGGEVCYKEKEAESAEDGSGAWEEGGASASNDGSLSGGAQGEESSEEEFSEEEMEGEAFAKNTGAYAPARAPTDDFFSCEEEESEEESEEEEEKPTFDFKEELRNSKHVGLIKVEPRDHKDYMNVGMIYDVVDKEVLVNAGVNRGSSIKAALETECTNAMSCIVWKSNEAWDFIRALASGEETLTTYCRFVVKHERRGEDVKTTEMYFKEIRNNGFRYNTRNRNNKVLLEIFDGCNRLKVFMMFVRGRLAVCQTDKQGKVTDRLYYSKEAAKSAGDAFETPGGEITLKPGISALDEEDHTLFNQNPWHLFLLHGTAQQCSAWARNFNMKSTPFKYYQEILIHIASCKSETYGSKIHEELRHFEWTKEIMDDTPTINMGMVLTWTLLKLHGLYKKPAYKINQPSTDKFNRVKRECIESKLSHEEQERNLGAIRKVLKEMKIQVDRTITETQSVAELDEPSRRRFKAIVCEVIDCVIEGRADTIKKEMTRQVWDNRSCGIEDIHAYMVGERDSLKKRYKRKHKKNSAPRRRRGASGGDDAVPPEATSDGITQATRAERARKRQAR